MTVYVAPDEETHDSDFGERVSGAVYLYLSEIAFRADGLSLEAFDEARTAAAYERALRHTLKDPGLRLLHILVGFDHTSNHEPIQVFGIKTSDRQK